MISTGHLIDAKDGQTAVRNAERYLQNPSAAQIDKELLHIAKKFENETGLEIAWTDSPYVLTELDREGKRVIMTIGWIIKSDDPKDRRRLAYLTDRLRHVRHTLERHPIEQPVKNDSTARSEARTEKPSLGKETQIQTRSVEKGEQKRFRIPWLPGLKP